MAAPDFQYRDAREPHAARAGALLRAHPEIRSLIGRTPATAGILLTLVAAQLIVAALLQHAPWWLIGVMAYTVGAVISHALFVVIHECTHNLVFARTRWNKVAAIVANVPQLLPSAMSFRRFHRKHHTHQGDYAQDLDVPSQWEARLMHGWFPGKALWLLLFPLFQVLRLSRVRTMPLVDRWVVLNWIVQLAANALIWVNLGPRGTGFLLLSFVFSVGLHPLGARWIQEHFLTAGQQETYSYYGPFNRLALNVGYHNEHHDFPSIPWNRLPALRAMVPSAYNALAAHRSWSLLLLRFLCDRELSLFSRMVRRPPVSSVTP